MGRFACRRGLDPIGEAVQSLGVQPLKAVGDRRQHDLERLADLLGVQRRLSASEAFRPGRERFDTAAKRNRQRELIGQLLDAGSPAGIDARCAAEIPAVPFVTPGKNK